MLPLPYNGPELLYSHKAKLPAEIFSKYSNFDYISIFLPAFPCRTNLKLDNIMVTLSLVKKVITNFDLSKVPGPDCVPVVVLTYCESRPFFLSGFSFAETDDSLDSREREGNVLFLSPTSNLSRTFRHLLVTLQVR